MKPTAFGRYCLLDRLAVGGMGEIHRATVDGPGGFQRTVAVKRVLPELSDDPSFVAAFVREAQLAARLHHPSIIGVYDFDAIDGRHYLAMEYVDGLDLSRLIDHAAHVGEPVPVGIAAFIAGEIAAALDYAHALTDENGAALGIVHRDVSPGNIMVTARGATKLLDFGVAKAVESITDEHTRTGIVKGNVSYLAPEQAEGLAIDGRADLFSLGAVLWECLTLRRLFHGLDDLDTLRLIRRAEVAPPSTVRPDMDAELDAVVLRLLARDPARRFARGGDVVRALGPIVHRLHGDNVALGRYVQSLGDFGRVRDTDRDLPVLDAPEPPRAPATVQFDARVTPRRRGWLLALGAALLALVVGLLLRWLR